jgi:hypothetical protein
MMSQEWIDKANELLGQQYGINLDDCTDEGEPPSFWYEEKPQAFVDYIADKYDLIPWSR